jgi:4-hydroxythreonine-4-phosphate dehydrogenase
MLGVTMGDACGVGPEIALKAFQSGEVARDFILVGDMCAMEYYNGLLGLNVPLRRACGPEDAAEGYLNVLDVGMLEPCDICPGEIGEAAGRAARACVERAVRLALGGRVAAVVTLPVNKEAVRLSDPGFTGHTELIAGLCGVSSYAMMLWSEKLIVTHVSTHVSMEQAVGLVKRKRVLDVIRLTHEALAGMDAGTRIAVAGLNPHAGESGAFGSEESGEILPAVEAARAGGADAYGPIAPDTVFVRAAGGQFDAVVCMYHDQGHIPVKLLDFEGGVNVTLGLQVVRTSVDHGTAFDIAGKGIASTKSYVKAFRLAEKMSGSCPPR